jgi:hypothetical protein
VQATRRRKVTQLIAQDGVEKRRAAMLFIGLHITKCAGTTLANHVQSRMPPKAWYMCSAFRDMQMNSMLEFAERSNHDAIRFIFGHFVHESLLSVFPKRDIFLFTGVRSPVDRAVSEYFQICKIRETARLTPIDADEFFAMRKNTMCVEILRAFPSLADDVQGSLADKAIGVCQMFDLLYDTKTFSESTGPLLRLIDVSSDGMRNVNTRDSEMAARLVDAEKQIRGRAPLYFGEDQKLFEFLAPHLGKPYPFGESQAQRVGKYRKRWEEKLRLKPDGMRMFSKHLAKHLVADYRNIGRTSELEALLRRKERWLGKLRELVPAATKV